MVEVTFCGGVGFIEDLVTEEFDNSGHILWRVGL